MKSATTVTDLDLKLSPEVLRIREKPRKLKAEGKPLDLNTFHFKQSQEALKNYKGNLSDAVREERDRW